MWPTGKKFHLAKMLSVQSMMPLADLAVENFQFKLVLYLPTGLPVTKRLSSLKAYIKHISVRPECDNNQGQANTAYCCLHYTR